MAVNIVTGMAGEDHIYSDDDRYRNAATFGKGKYVFDIGEKLKATVVNDNLVRISDGMCINQGTQMGIEPGDYEDVPVENGSVGMRRNDIIFIRYEKNIDTGIESAKIDLIEGESTFGEPIDPLVINGNILDGGALVDDYPLYRVRVRGVNIAGVDQLFHLYPSDIARNNERLDDLDEEVEDIKEGKIRGAVRESVFDKLGTKNLFDIDDFKKNSDLRNGVISYFPESDGSIKGFRLASVQDNCYIVSQKIPAKKGDSFIATWIHSGLPESERYSVSVYEGNPLTEHQIASVSADSNNVSFSVTGNDSEYIYFKFIIYSADNESSYLYFMVRYSDYISSQYATYAMSNNDLTKLAKRSFKSNKHIQNAIDSANDGISYASLPFDFGSILFQATYDSNEDYKVQFAFPISFSENKFAVRTRDKGTFYDWRYFYSDKDIAHENPSSGDERPISSGAVYGTYNLTNFLALNIKPYFSSAMVGHVTGDKKIVVPLDHFTSSITNQFAVRTYTIIGVGTRTNENGYPTSKYANGLYVDISSDSADSDIGLTATVQLEITYDWPE